jgi:hypothetical protein
MKHSFIACIVICYLFTACNNSKKPDPASANGQATEIKPAETMGAPSKEEELQSLVPYTTDEIKALLPKELGGANLSDPSSGKVTGTAYAKGLYQLNDSMSFELTLFDCGGDAGSGFYKHQFLGILDRKPESEDEEVKTIDFNGNKAIEHYDNNSYRSTFTYVSGRFLVTLESEFADIKALKKIANSLKIK